MSIPDFVKILEVKRYSQNTISVYSSVAKLAISYFGTTIEHLSDKELHNYFYHLVHNKNASYSYQKQIALGLKIYYKEIYNRDIHLEFLMPKRKPKKLPVILSEKEIQLLLDSTKNAKHKSMIAMAYSAGLRVGELLAMKIKDIDSDRMIVHIKESKGNKDRIVPLSERTLALLRTYYREFTPKEYLFEGAKGGMYSASSFNKLLKNLSRKAKIKKPFTSHNLRHSYATHLLENGTDVRVIQKLLGHNSLNTTMIYTQVAKPMLLNIKSPFDNFI